MTERPFRFGLVAATAGTGAAWTATARRAEELGFDTLLVPDTLNTLTPAPALAAAAAVTGTLHVGSYVLSVPNRSPGLVTWETETLQLLSDGRFELGLGGGRPGGDRDAEALGGSFGTPADRLRRTEEIIEAVRKSRTPPPILVAASRPRMLWLAAERADIVALGLPPSATEDDLAGAVTTLREAAGDRFDALELHLNAVAVAESAGAVPDWVSRMTGGGDARAMAAAGGIAFLLGTPDEIAGTLLRRRATYGVSYVAVNSVFAETFAPVIDRLRNR
jgi:probable F420-dependent oxidoreductase